MAVSEEREELRCLCGSLLARALDEGIELRCRRCKRVVIIPYSEVKGAESVIRLFQEWARGRESAGRDRPCIGDWTLTPSLRSGMTRATQIAAERPAARS